MSTPPTTAAPPAIYTTGQVARVLGIRTSQTARVCYLARAFGYPKIRSGHDRQWSYVDVLVFAIGHELRPARGTGRKLAAMRDTIRAIAREVAADPTITHVVVAGDDTACVRGIGDTYELAHEWLQRGSVTVLPVEPIRGRIRAVTTTPADPAPTPLPVAPPPFLPCRFPGCKARLRGASGRANHEREAHGYHHEDVS